jgi:guanylate kinase
MSNSAPAGDPAAGRRGLLFIVSAPSGTGKTTVVERLVQVVPGLCMSRSYTSRPAREGERDGVDYNFISRERFAEMVHDGQFLEWADVFGNCYGTCAADTERLLAGGQDVVLVIDVQGARQVRSRGIETTGIFVLPPSAAILEQRLRGRSKDSEDQIRRRLDVARREVEEFERYELPRRSRRVAGGAFATAGSARRKDHVKSTPKDNRFEFVVLAGLRARQLLAGSVPREAGEKKITVAQREILRRKVVKIEEEAD